MYVIREFCKERKTGRKIEDAFIAYCKATISDSYNIKSGQTVTGLLIKLNEEELLDMWMEFIADLKRTLSEN